jgi:hypothetical protein
MALDSKKLSLHWSKRNCLLIENTQILSNMGINVSSSCKSMNTPKWSHISITKSDPGFQLTSLSGTSRSLRRWHYDVVRPIKRSSMKYCMITLSAHLNNNNRSLLGNRVSTPSPPQFTTQKTVITPPNQVAHPSSPNPAQMPTDQPPLQALPPPPASFVPNPTHHA